MRNLHNTKRIAMILVTALCCLSFKVVADSRSGAVTYSPENWPNRWSSAIRQQQDGGRYPTRQKPTKPILREDKTESVSEDDLFYLPTGRHGHKFDRRLERFDDHLSRQRYYRDAQRMSRDAAYAYHDFYPAYPYAGFAGPYNGFPYGTAPMGIDPVLGSPGIGIPIMPGTPFGYPFVGYPGVWGGYPPFGVW